VPRVELDAALVQHARALGIEVHDGSGVTALQHDGGAVTATLQDGTELTTHWLVAADGHYSPVRRLVGDGGADANLGSWHAFRQYFTDVDDRRLWVMFEEDFLPGYAWMFPVGGGRANVGFGVLRDPGHSTPSGKALAAQWRSLAERPSMLRALGPRARPEGSVRAWPIPAGYDRERLTRGRVLFVGDAAEVVDPMTGEGVAQALESGMLAARAIASAPGDVGAATRRYRDDVDRALGADLRLAARLQHLLRVPLGARAALAAASLTPWTRRNFGRWMWEDYPRALLFTPRRWRRGMLSATGAYSLDSSHGRH
jgi:flavin-dependent dehydrogenase